jgi:peroxiredoxin
MNKGDQVPMNIRFVFRQGDNAPEDGGCPIGGEFVHRTSQELFANKRVIVFSLPGAYTPTCSTQQLPGFEKNYEVFKKQGIDEIYVASVNDAFVMNAWLQHLGVERVRVLPDGNGEFASSLGCLADFSSVGFGMRSKRFAVILDDGVVEQAFVEPDATEMNTDPYGASAPETVLAYLETQAVTA